MLVKIGSIGQWRLRWENPYPPKIPETSLRGSGGSGGPLQALGDILGHNKEPLRGCSKAARGLQKGYNGAAKGLQYGCNRATMRLQ